MKGKVYRLKEGIDLNKLEKFDYEIIPSEPIVLVKIVEQDFDSELVQGSLENIYNNGEWRSRIYAKHEKEMAKTLGLKYKRGKAVISDKFRHVLTDWRIQIEPYGDGWLGFASLDPFDKMVYYASVHLDTYCADHIKALLDADLIELVEVDEEEEARKEEERQKKAQVPDDVEEVFGMDTEGFKLVK